MRSFRSLIMLALLLPAGLSAQKEFEGAVTYNMTGQGMSIELKQMVKGRNMRMEMNMGGMGMVTLMNMDEMATKVTMLVPAQKMYMTMNPQEMASQMGVTLPNADHEPNVTVHKMDQKETIAGHSCQHVEVMVDENRIDYCVATDLGYFFGAGSGMGGGGRGRGAAASPQGLMSQKAIELLKKEFKEGFFPLKVNLTANGTQMTLEATSVEKMSVSDDMFTVPKDYTAMAGRGMPPMD